MKKIPKRLTDEIKVLQSFNLNEYASDQMEFSEPLSALSSVKLMTFKSNCRLIEKLFKSIDTDLLDFKFSAGNYGVNVYLTFSHKSTESIKENRWLLYGFFTHIFPVNYRELDWFEDKFIHQTLSSFFEPNDKEFVRLKLSLNYDQFEVEFPSHDFFCLSQKEIMEREENLALA